MTDDGTALGAALHVASTQPDFQPTRLQNMFLGFEFPESDAEASLKAFGLKYERTEQPAEWISDRLASGSVVGVFQGRMEFGPQSPRQSFDHLPGNQGGNQ